MVEFLDGGSLQDLVDSGGTRSEGVVAHLAYQIARGLRSLHSRGFVHRDIKPANLLLSRKGVLKISDFGIARRLDRESQMMTRTFVGTANYMSPERIGCESYDASADVWGLAASVFAVATGAAPFQADRAASSEDGYWSLLGDIRDAPAPELPAGAGPWSADIRAFLAKSLAKDAARRPTADDLLATDAFLRSGAAAPATDADSDGSAPSPAKAALRARNALLLDATLDAVRAHLEDRLAGRRLPGAPKRSPPPLVAAATALLDGTDGLARFTRLADQLDMTEDQVEAAVRRRLQPQPPAPELDPNLTPPPPETPH